MNSKLSVAVIVLLLAGATFVAGCTSSSSSSNDPLGIPSTRATPTAHVTVTPTPYVTVTPTVTPVVTVGPKQVAAHFEQELRNRGFAIRQPLTWRNNDRGNYEFSGTLALGMATVHVTIVTFDNIYDTQNGAIEYRTAFINQGYTTVVDAATWWTGVTVNSRAWILVNTQEDELWDMVFYIVPT